MPFTAKWQMSGAGPCGIVVVGWCLGCRARDNGSGDTGKSCAAINKNGEPGGGGACALRPAQTPPLHWCNTATICETPASPPLVASSVFPVTNHLFVG
uniref:Uncharacterized protein n=1 Tax=Oryza punctata TaxID=4537 RepID=A0A0E0L2A9_ORYPU